MSAQAEPKNRTTKVVVVSEIPTPYRLPVYRRLAEQPGLELEVLFCGLEQPNRPWRLKDELAGLPHVLLPGFGLPIGRRGNTFVYEVNPTILRELGRRRPDVLVIGGYAVFAEQAAIAWARARHVPFLLHSESHLLKPRSRLKGAVKEAVLPRVIAGAAGGLAAGSAAARYLEHYGIPRERIRIFPNTVDVPLYRDLSRRARERAAVIRRERQLPERYWLFAGRLVEAKGLPELLAALRLLGDTSPELLVAGVGPLADELRSTPNVRLLGFQGRDELIELMALAELTVVPSRDEPWGVVVNEALAAGCPVIVTDQVGAAEDLVVDGTNGRIVPAGDARALAAALVAPPPAGARDRGPIDRWDHAFAVEQFLEAVGIAAGTI